MCGIAGILNFNGEKCKIKDIRGMCQALAHRGPDDEGHYIDKNLALGHRRLSIIDLSSAGHQPMFNEDGNIAVVCNGEIYNFKELRKELENLGHRFSSRTDTEVIIHGYEEWGLDCVHRLNGMFAFALWDKRKKTLTLIRDRYGIKPLYYWKDGKTLLFASEIKAFLRHPSFKVDLDLETLFEYLTFQNTFTYKTLFQKVALLPQGSFMQFSLQKSNFTLKKYWDFCFKKEEKPRAEKIYIEELNRLFEQAVKRQLISDVEIGSFLSGGIDSSSITAIISRHFSNLKTFCIGFDLDSASGLELSFDERKKAEYISRLYQTKHYEMVLKAGDLKNCLARLVWHLEDLRLGQSYPNFYASELASKFVKVCLSGTGGDELFAGYPWRYYQPIKGRNSSDCSQGYYKYWQRLLPNSDLRKLFSPVQNEIKHINTHKIFKDTFSDHRFIPENPEDLINQSLYFEAKTFLHGLLVVEDKLSMAHSLEIRVPFLDHDLFEFATKIPARLKLKNIGRMIRWNENEIAKREKVKRQDGKIILRKVLSRYVPEKVTKQYKQGFSGPDSSWFKGESINYVREFLLNKKAGIYNYLDYKIAKKFIQEHIEGKYNRRLFIWSLLCLEWWMRVFLDEKKA